jgi:7,8-dihydro-6-hydroxymethylpterin dimethyltransferase
VNVGGTGDRTTEGMEVRADRIHRYVTAYCPECHREDPDRPLPEVGRLPGYLTEADDRVWLVRFCPTHGRVVTMYEEDPKILRYLEQWTAPTKVHAPDTIGNYLPPPSGYLRGLGELQTQHTCILLEDVTEACNLRCPTCFASSSPDLSGIVAVEDVLASLDARLVREHGRIDVLMLSGGEPTVHPEIERILEEAASRNVVRILLNTNGIRIAKDDAFLAKLVELRERVEIYLQFDGFHLETHRHHRGGDLRKVKREVVERLSSAGIFTTLTMTASLGVNDDEIGDVVLLALETPYIGGVSVQPMFGSGRSPAMDPMDRLTHTGVLKRLGRQTGGVVTWRDLTALPCSHPHCCSVGYMLRSDGGEWRSLVSLIGPEPLKAHLELVSNTIADWKVPRTVRRLVKQSLLDLLSEQSSLTHPTVPELFRNVCVNCDLGVGDVLRGLLGRTDRAKIREWLGAKVKRITVKPFMDVHTMLEERLLQCCVHVGTRGDAREHQCAPFCAVQAWPALSAQKLAARGAARVTIPLEEVSDVNRQPTTHR